MTAQTPKEVSHEDLVKFLVRGRYYFSLPAEQYENDVGRRAQERGYCRLDTRSIVSGHAWFSLTKLGIEYLEEMKGILKPALGIVTGYFFVMYPGTETEERFESLNWKDAERWYEIRRMDRRLWVPGATSSGTYLQTAEGIIEASFWQWPCFIGKPFYRNQCYQCAVCTWQDRAASHGLWYCYSCKKKEDKELEM